MKCEDEAGPSIYIDYTGGKHAAAARRLG